MSSWVQEMGGQSRWLMLMRLLYSSRGGMFLMRARVGPRSMSLYPGSNSSMVGDGR